MRPGAGLYYIKVAGTSALARHRYHIHLVRSLLDEAHQGTLIPLQYTEVLHLYRWNTHTCSEIAYRIIDVERIVRAKNTSVNLTGEIG